VASNGITFITNFVKIGQLSQKLKGRRPTRRQHGDHINLLYFLNEGKWARSSAWKSQ
jgi:hypothetical protein